MRRDDDTTPDTGHKTETSPSLARRAVASKHWRWMPGMLCLPGNAEGEGGRYLGEDHGGGNVLSDRHRLSSQAGATLDGFLEVGWGRVFYFVNRAGVMAVEDADDRVSHHRLETVGVTARGMASLFPRPGGGS